jgi:hypothetical protein
VENEVKAMAVRRGVLQDYRKNSRVIALLDCKLTCKDLTYDAVIVDISQLGAMIMSQYLPPTGSEVTLTVYSKHLKNALKLDGTVLRGTRVNTELGNKGRFSVRFHQSPLSLFDLLGKLSQSS